MAKKGKMKISKVKRNNHTTNKMKKSGQMKLQRHRPKAPQKQKQQVQSQIEYSSDSDSESADEFADMLDDGEQEYIMNRLSKNPQLLSTVPEKDEGETKQTKKRKRSRDPKPKSDMSPDSGAGSDSASDEAVSDVEEKYEKDLADRPAKKLRPLLPIKTKEGLMERAEEVDETDSEKEEEDKEPVYEEETLQFDSETEPDSGLEGAEEESREDKDEVVTTVQLLAARRDALNKEKLRIGALCSSLLESPEKKLKNLYPILYLMEEQTKDGTSNLHSVRKLATLSVYEVFKDILPEYQIRHQDYSNIKLKKDTLALYKFEKELLEFYKRYLQRLEKATAVLRRKRGDTRKPDESLTSLALVSLRALCGLLTARPYFNYAANIAQSVVPLLAARGAAGEVVDECCRTVFREDAKGEITLTIVRLINQLVKRRGDRLNPSALDCLLSLKIKDVELDAEEDVKSKQRLDEKHKKRIVNLSKKEKKRSKKLKEVERELLETQAQESSLERKKQLTEVTRVVFHIYFRLLKAGPRSKLLAAALKGLAKFTHVINLEYYTELVSILVRLIEDTELGAKERLLCVQTALAVLAGAGDALNVDPARLHAQLYQDMILIHAGSNHEDSKIVLGAISEVTARARRVSAAVLQAVAKRLTSAALQLHHNSAAGALVLVYNLAQQSKAVSSLLDSLSEEAIGSGRFNPYLPSPEHCNAHSASLAELTSLRRHYHPVVCAVATALVNPGTQLPREVAKMSPVKIFEQYDGSQLAFKPTIPPPKKQPTSSKRPAAHAWNQASLKEMCEAVEGRVKDSVDFTPVFNKR